jgi:hypothetical protein
MAREFVSSVLRIPYNASLVTETIVTAARKLNVPEKIGLADARSRVRLITFDCLLHLTANLCFIYWDLFVIPQWYSNIHAPRGHEIVSRFRVLVNIMVMPGKRISIQFRYLARLANKSCAPSLGLGKSIFIVNILILTMLLGINEDICRRIAKVTFRLDFISTFYRQNFNNQNLNLINIYIWNIFNYILWSFNYNFNLLWL